MPAAEKTAEDNKTPEVKKTKKTVEDKTTEDKKTPEGKKAKKTVEDKTTEDKKTPEGKKAKKTVEDKTTEDKKIEGKKTKKTVEDKTTEDKEKKKDAKKAPQSASAEQLFGSKETIFSKENLSKESAFEYEDFDVRMLEKDAFDVDSAASTGGSSELFEAPEFSARDTDDIIVKAPLPAIKKKLYRIIKTITKKKYFGVHYQFNFGDVVKTLKLVKTIFMNEPVVMMSKAPAVIVGDIHGQYADLVRIFSTFHMADGTPGYFAQRYVFLGDYVDRGKQSLEVIMLLFWLKILYPQQFVMLRGNHEFRAINKTYGFYDELTSRFQSGVQGDILFEQFNDVFCHLPLCCFVGGSILCMHGGISSKMKSRDDLLKIRKPLKDSKEDPVACDLMWADPMVELKGEKRNNVRGVSVYFGEDQLVETMAALNIKLVVRGHQMMQNGFCFFHGFRLATVFSASSYYPDKPNRGAVMTVALDGRIGFKMFAPLPKDHPAIVDADLFRKIHDTASETGGHAVNKPPGKPASKK